MIKYRIIPFLFLMVLTGCTEKIDVDLGESYERLVVEGYITNEAGPHQVELSKSTGYFDPGKAAKVEGAVVILDDGVNPPDTLAEHPEKAGIYQTDSSYRGVAGRQYHLRIELAEPIHETTVYEATCEMPPQRYLDSIYVYYKKRWDAWEVRSFAEDPATEDFYMFDLYKNDTVVTDTITEAFVTEDRLFNGQSTNGAAIGYFQAEYPDEVVRSGDTIKARIAGITKEHFNFLMDVREESGYQNPLFSGPPANIRGNISNDGIGFFGAFAVDYASTVYRVEGEDE